MKPTVKATSTGSTARLRKQLQDLTRKQVLVGVPESTNERKGELFKIGRTHVQLDATVSNAQLAFILSRGSALQSIPPRPFLEPTLQGDDAKALYVPELEAAAKAVLDEQPREANQHLAKAGVLAANSVKRFLTDSENGLAPNAPSTIARKGSSTPLIDTGQLRRAITSVVVDE